ncbi:hypothetical protein ACIBUY_03955 [Streptomyces sp. NPDC050085]
MRGYKSKIAYVFDDSRSASHVRPDIGRTTGTVTMLARITGRRRLYLR